MPTGQLSIDDIFAEALRRPQGSERANYLAEVYGQDAAARERMERLLRAHVEACSFLETPAADSLATAKPEPPITERPGTVIGPYKLLQQIGEGGMGVVFMAEQTEPIHRTVALKIIKPGMDTRQVIARLEAERQALAMMDHPNIARVLDAGTTDADRPYFVMDLVKGVPITEYCDQQHLPIRARLELMSAVCHAVQHAHQKGIIHRDLKPSNVLVAEYDGKPVPKIIDFGVAKATAQRLTEKTMFTEYGQLIGTFEYMSPEQARFNQLDVDTRSDIYSLGVLLYEVLAGSTPLEKERLRSAAFAEVLRMICEEEPPRPSLRLSSSQALPSISAQRQIEPAKLKKLVRGELDWIVMKCLEKDRNRRYETASALAGDILHYLNDEAINARPSTPMYRLKKFIRRNTAGVLAGSAIASALIVGIALSSWLYVRERAEHRQAVVAEEAAKVEAAKSQQVALFLKDMLQGAFPQEAKGRDASLLRDILDVVAMRVSKELKNQPEVQAELLETIGAVYNEIGPMDKAETCVRDSLTIRRQVFGDEHLEIADSLYLLGYVQWRQDNLADAERLTRQAFEMQRKLGGPDSPDAAQSLIHLGGILWSEKKLAESEAVLREAVPLMKRLYGERSLQSGTALLNLGMTLGAENKFDEAERTLRDVVDIMRAQPDTEQWRLAGPLRELGILLRRAGKPDEAETVLREAVAIHRQRTDQKGDLYLAWSLDALAELLDSQGRLGEAEELLRESLAIKRRVFGDKQTQTVTTFDWLITVLKKQSKTDEIEQLRREVANAAAQAKSSADATRPDAEPSNTNTSPPASPQTTEP